MNELIDLQQDISKKRLLHFDLAKYIAITLVVIGHTYPLTIGYQSHLREIIYSFHMPLFFFISGYFSNRSYFRPPILFFKQKSIQLLLPTISCIIVSCILLYLWGKSGFFRDELIGGVWFLRVLFLCYAFCYVLWRIGWKIVGGIVLSIILFVIPGGGVLKLNMMFLFFLIGIAYNQFERYVDSNIIVFICIFLFITLSLTGNATDEDKITFSYICQFPLKFITSFIAGITGTISVIGLCKVFTKHFHGRRTELFTTIGKYTLGLYIIQTIFVERLMTHYYHLNISSFPIEIIDYIITPFIGFFLTIMCYAIVRILKRNHYINLILFGNQY